jgi:hypothetical protein
MEAARSGGHDDGVPAPPSSCAQRLIDLFVDELQAAVSVDVRHSVRYATLGDMHHPTSWDDVRARVIAVAHALAATLPDDGGAVEVVFSGVRVSGSVRISLAVAAGQIELGALAAELDQLGCAVVAADGRRLVVAYFPGVVVHARA